MQPDFSEFSYGFALTREICERWKGGLRAAPVFPSLIEEGRAGGGYDVRVKGPGFPLFLQFKISEYMTRASAGEWGQFGSQYYRLWLHAPRHSDQHKLLLRRDRAPNVVLYAAPAIHKLRDLNRAFLTGSVLAASIFFRPRAIGPLPDDDAHCIAFQRGSGLAWLCSEPVQVPVAAFGDGLRNTLSHLSSQFPLHEPTDDFFGQMAQDLEAEAREEIELDEPLAVSRMESPRERVAFIARALLGAELLWISRSTGVAA
jgi:hypothetical protein